MAPIVTYVFFDTETTGLPSEENNETKITELSLVAVKTEHLLRRKPGEMPRVQNKLTLCFDPRRPITKTASTISKLTNDLLENETSFAEALEIIASFLNVLTKPVCLVAYNGLQFDYPIFKNNILLNGDIPFCDDLLVTDACFGLYDILEEEKHEGEEPQTKKSKVTKSLSERSKFPWGNYAKRPKESYKLKDVYERVTGRQSQESKLHLSEYDCMMMLEITAKKASEIVKWMEKNNVKFSNIKAMD